jgi:hypothetical protein
VNKRRRKEKKTYLCVEKKRRKDNGLRIEVEREEKERYGDLGGGEKKRNVIVCFDFRDSSILIWVYLPAVLPIDN